MNVRLLYLPFLVMATACGNSPDSIESLRTELGELSYKVAIQENDIEVLGNKLDVANARIGGLTQRDVPAFLTLGEGYGVSENHLGLALLVAWDDSKPQGDGTLLKLRVGNPHSAVFNGLKVNLSHFAARPTAEKPQVIERTLVDVFPPGRWTRVDVRIPGVKPEEIESVTVGLTPDVLAMP